MSAPLKPFRRLAPAATPDVDAQTGLATFIFNDESVGRDGHVVRNAGIKTAHYLSNPVILWAHSDTDPPIGRAVDIDVNSPASKVTIEFTPRPLNPFGAMIGDLVKARYLNCVSESWAPIKAKRLAGGDGMDFLEVDLLEISVVPIPALPTAVATARSLGIDVEPMRRWSESALARGGLAGVDRGELLKLQRAASGRSTAYSLPSDGGRAQRLARARQLAGAYGDDGRAERSARAKEIQQRETRRRYAEVLLARGTSKLPPASRAALEQVQQHHERCERSHGELQRRHTRMADNVEALPDIHRALTRAVSVAGVSKDYGVSKALADFQRCADGIAADHDGAASAVDDAAGALGLAQAGVASVVDGLAELGGG